MMKNDMKLTIVGEVACAHEGDLNSLFEMIDVAARAGLDVIQFQFFQADEITTPTASIRDLALKLQLPTSSYKEIFDRSRAKGLRIWATAGDLVSAKEAFNYQPEMWRVHSGDVNNLPLIEFLCKTGVPISFSVGGSTPDEIDYALNSVSRLGGQIKALVHGFQGYPTPIEEANLSFIRTLKDRYVYQIGYQDHTDPEDPLATGLSLMALAYGAEIIEKHFILDRSEKGIDHHSSLNPDELSQFVAQIKRAWLALGSPDKSMFGKKEAEYRKTFKKGFVFRRPLSLGDKLSIDDIKIVRCDDLEIYGNRLKELLGKTLKHDVKKDQTVRLEDFNG